MVAVSFAYKVTEITEKIRLFVGQMTEEDPHELLVLKGRVLGLCSILNEAAEMRLDASRVAEARKQARGAVAAIPVPLPRAES